MVEKSISVGSMEDFHIYDDSEGTGEAIKTDGVIDVEEVKTNEFQYIKKEVIFKHTELAGVNGGIMGVAGLGIKTAIRPITFVEKNNITGFEIYKRDHATPALRNSFIPTAGTYVIKSFQMFGNLRDVRFYFRNITTATILFYSMSGRGIEGTLDTYPSINLNMVEEYEFNGTDRIEIECSAYLDNTGQDDCLGVNSERAFQTPPPPKPDEIYMTTIFEKMS